MGDSAGAVVRLLGGLSVRVRSRDVTQALGGRVGRLAFVYLVLHRERPVRRDELAEAIWEERAPADPDAALRVVLTRLRKALGGDAVQGRGELYLKLPEPVSVDVESLRACDDPGAVIRLASCELVPGLEAGWITAERGAVGELRTDALMRVGRDALGVGELERAEDAARLLVALAPFRESGYRLLIEALARRGEEAEALRVYEEFRRLLREELGAVPSAELAAIHMRLLQAGDEATSRPTGATSERLPLPVVAAPPGRPALVGRERELERLDRLLGPGAASVVLIGGEPGIGKSRLAAEFAVRAHAGGANVVWGRCHEEALVPYEPFVEALRQYAAALSDQALAELAHAAGTEFLALAPDLARRLPRAALAPVADDPQARRFRLFEAVAEVLTLAAVARRLIVVLEDLHWADRGTMLLLGHIVRRAAVSPLLIVGTYRTTELPEEHLLRSLPRSHALELGGLTPDQAARIVAELSPGSEPAQRVYAETEGNPLFILEVLRARLEGGDDRSVPKGVTEVIGRRLRRLGADASTLLGVGAVLGRSFTATEVAHVSGLPQVRLLDAVEESIAARVIEEVPGTPEKLAFTHALIREVRYRQHSAARRTALHRAAAEAVRAIYAGELEEHLADLATHLAAAVRDRASARAAVEALRQAGEQAAARQAFEDAAGWLSRASGLFDTARPSDAGRCDVLLGLAEALRASDRIEEARAAAGEAAELAHRLDDGERLARAAIAFTGSHLVFKAGRPDQRDIALLEEAVGSLPASATALRVRLLARLCTAIYYSERFDEVPELAQRALELAEAGEGDDAMGWAYYAQFWASLHPEGIETADSAMRRLAPIAARTGSVELAMEANMVEWYGLLRAGRPDLLAAALDGSREGIVETGIPIYRWFADAIGAMLAVTEGRFEEAEPIIGEVARSGAAIDPHDLPRFATIPMLQLRHHQGRLGELVDPLRVVVVSNPGLPLWRAVLLEALVAAGALDEARQQLRGLAAGEFGWLRRDVNWLWATTAISSACVSLGAAEVAEVLYRLLTAIPAQSVVCGPALGFFGPVRRYLAPLAALLGRDQEAAEHYQQALAELDRAGATPLASATRQQRTLLLPAA